MPEFSVKQRLAAILAADVAGYSRLMAGTSGRPWLRSIPRALFFGHRSMHTRAGSSTWRETRCSQCSRPRPAPVAAALAVQEGLAAMAGEVSEDRRMRFRIGVHLGDIMEKADGTVYGDGVNIAARLEGLAEPGGITVSDAVQGAVRGKVAASFIDQGEQQVKNIPTRCARSASIGRIRAPAHRPPNPELPAGRRASGSAFDRGTSLRQHERRSGAGIFRRRHRRGHHHRAGAHAAFFVIARNSSFVYKGKAVDIKQVGRELGVRYVLEGSVRKAGNRVRITGQLIEAENGRHVWADRFEGTLDDIFELQDRITESVVGAIEPSIRRAEIDRVRLKPTNNLDAYDLCLRALPGLRARFGESGKRRSARRSCAARSSWTRHIRLQGTGRICMPATGIRWLRRCRRCQERVALRGTGACESPGQPHHAEPFRIGARHARVSRAGNSRAGVSLRRGTARHRTRAEPGPEPVHRPVCRGDGQEPWSARRMLQSSTSHEPCVSARATRAWAP